MLSVSKEALFRLIDIMVSASAHSGEGLRAAGEAWLNPQPEPPGRAATLQPEPWRSAAVARQVITMAGLSHATAADRESGLRTARSILGVFVDYFFGVTSNRFPLPPPWAGSRG